MFIHSLADQTSVISIISEAHWVVKVVMALLLLMSIGCWYIIVAKYLTLARVARQTTQFNEAFWRSRNIEDIYSSAQELRESPLSAMFLAGYTELAKLTKDGRPGDRDGDLENVTRALSRAETSQVTELESKVPFLATTGSSAPFIGLFGTVWGIMFTIRGMGNPEQAQISVIAPEIAEALLATAVGLVAAIPAVMAYNYFQRRIRVLRSQMESFEKDYLNIVRRHFLK